MKQQVQIAVVSKKNKVVSKTFRVKVDEANAINALTAAISELRTDEKLADDDIYQAKISII